MKAYSAESLVTYYNDALELESEILADSGDFRGAYENLLRLQHSRDSLASEQLAIQLSEFYTLYEVDRLEARRQRQKIVIVMTGSLCLLLLITIAVFIVYEAVKEGHFSGRGRGNVRIRSLFIILQGIYEKIRHDAAGIQEIPEIAAIFANCNMLFPKGSAYEPRTVVTLVLSPGQMLSLGFSSAHMEHIHIHVGDKVYMPEYTSSEEYVQSVSLEIEIPQEDFEVVACYSVQQQLTEGGYTMRLEDNENVRLFGVSEKMQYKYFDCYLLTEDAWSITDVQFKVGGGEWNIVSDVNGCSFSRDDENDNLYRIKIRPDYQNVTGDVTLRVTGEQHGRYSITWENATGEFIDLEKSVLPDMSIDGETVTAEIWVNDGLYLNTAASSVEGLDLEVTARSYVEFVMPAEDVTITLDIREKIPVTYTESENVSPQSQQKIPREMT